MNIRVYSNLPRVYLDMDGPLADFDFYCQSKGYDPTIAKKFSGTYLNLPPTVGAIEAVKKLMLLKNIEVFILSKIPAENPGAATEKHFWLARYIPALSNRLILSPDKGCVGTVCDFLIDDHPELANAHNFPGEIITFKTVVNQTGQSWSEILTYFSTRFQLH